MWHVDAVRLQGAENKSRGLEHVLFSAGRKLAWPIGAEVKEVD